MTARLHYKRTRYLFNGCQPHVLLDHSVKDGSFRKTVLWNECMRVVANAVCSKAAALCYVFWVDGDILRTIFMNGGMRKVRRLYMMEVLKT